MPDPRIIVHLPHASSVMPSLAGFVGDWRGEIDLLTDWGTDQLFDLPNGVTVAAPCSRVFCDVERYADDAQEPMAALGMGFAYTRTDAGLPLRTVDDALHEHLLQSWYLPHHRRLAAAIDDDLAAGHDVLLIDGHSFSDIPFQRDPDQSRPRPDLCLGTDPTWTPPHLCRAASSVIEQHGLTCAINRPYAGTMVPSGIADRIPPGRRFASIMIEINRRLYLDGTQCRPEAVEQMRSIISSCVRDMCAAW
jgi:N-formylglutamate deformylase